MKRGHAMKLFAPIAALLLGCAATTPPPRTQAVAREAPDFLAARADGTQVRFWSFRGQVVVLHLWASWCAGCEDDLPLLDEMAARIAPAGIHVIAVSLDTDREKFVRIAKSRPWRFVSLNDPEAHVGDLYEPQGLPAVFIVDATGTIRSTRHGLNKDSFVEIEEQARAVR
jgi:cytochrome c biogenesis protein CcmG/thiol:disulfide interchange protein DsbE